MDIKDDKVKLGSLEQSVKEYVNLRVDEYKYRGVENFSILSNKTLVVLVAVMLGAVILQLAGFAIAFMIGELVGSTAIGFGATALIFVVVLLVVYAKRDSLFLGKMFKMYSRMFFGSEIADVKAARQENSYKIKMKEMELSAYLKTLKEYLNPLTYINYAVSKMSALENIVTAFIKGYTTVKEMVSDIRNRNRNKNNKEEENNPDNNSDNIPDNNQQ